MAVMLSPDTHKRMIASIRKYVGENFDEEVGDLKAGMLLEFVLKEIAPTVYNQAIADAQTFFQARVADLEGVCYEEEFGYWPGPRRSSA
jgi:uncharacterized protein (DUF2164 family)